MFYEAKCDFCGECLERCHYLDFDRNSGGKKFKKLVRGEKVDWLDDCVTCYACNENCSKGARPFDLIIKRLEEKGDFADQELLKKMEERFAANKEPRPVEIKGRVMSACVMTGDMPWAMQGQIFENLTILKGRPYFCNVLFTHMGNESIMRKRAQKMVDNLAASGADEIIFIHEDCYALLNNIALEYGIKIPFKVVHFFEYLWDFLQENKEKIKKLNMKVAYQRPCASRFTKPEIENILNDILELIGVERVARKYDGNNALCCGVEMAGPQLKLFPRGKDYEPFRVKNIADARVNEAEAMLYLCPMCFNALKDRAREAGMRNYMVSDICRLALGEELPEDKPY